VPSLGIDLSRTYISECEEHMLDPATTPSGTRLPPPPPPAQQRGAMSARSVPSEPGRPEVVEVTDETVSLAWLPPEREGEAGRLHGYQVEFRTSVAEPWEPAHDVLLAVTDCKSEWGSGKNVLFLSYGGLR